MTPEVNIPKEGELHSVVAIGPHRFELRYGYREERDRSTGEPYLLYPDLATQPLYAEDGRRIVSALQSACPYYAVPHGREREDCCYTCSFYANPDDEIGICQCDKNRASHHLKEDT